MKNTNYHANDAKARRTRRVRAKLFGTAQRPRVTVYRSNRYISAQAIDDNAQKTLVFAKDAQQAEKLNKKSETKLTKTQRATVVGEMIAQQLKTMKIQSVVFDRGPYRYHGRIKAVADALRAQGVQV